MKVSITAAETKVQDIRFRVGLMLGPRLRLRFRVRVEKLGRGCKPR